MKELIRVDYQKDSVAARDVYDFVFTGKEKKTAFNVWFARAVTKYGFEEGKDFQSFMIKSTGGRPQTDHAVTLDMAKELCMVAPTDYGKKARQYFLKCEEIVRNTYAKRIASKEIRKELTDVLLESGENERMHGRGYSNYTRLVYSITGLTEAYKEYSKEKKTGFRDSLPKEYLERVMKCEALIKPLLGLEKQYSEIKDILAPVFKEKKEAING